MINSIRSRKVLTQRHNQADKVFDTLSALSDLGLNNHKAFYYPKGLTVLVLENNKEYIWQETSIIVEQFGDAVNKVLTDDFTYPEGVVVDNLDYSNKAYNFYELGGGDVNYTNLNLMPVTVGGYNAGTSFNNRNNKQMWDGLLYPTLNPTLANPSAIFTLSQTNLILVSSVIGTLQLTSTFNRGSISPAYSTSGFRAGTAIARIFTGTGTTNQTSSANTLNYFISNYTVVIGLNTWTCKVTYNEGEQPLDSAGNPFSTPLPAGETDVITRSFEGVYPLFCTSNNITTATQQVLVSMITGTNIVLNLVAEPNNINKQFIEIPNIWLTNRPIIGIQEFNANSGNFEYPGGSAASSLTYYTQSSVVKTIIGNNINYTRFTHNSTQRGALQIRLIF
jgi:hypothetical protein